MNSDCYNIVLFGARALIVHEQPEILGIEIGIVCTTESPIYNRPYYAVKFSGIQPQILLINEGISELNITVTNGDIRVDGSLLDSF